VSRGEIHPLEALPADWQEGQPVRVEKVDDGETSVEEIDRDFAVLASLCEASEPADEEQLERALQESRRPAQGQGRRQMGVAEGQTTYWTATTCRRRCAKCRRCGSAFTRGAGRGIVSSPATLCSVSWKWGFSRPRSQMRIVAGWPSCCATFACGLWMPRQPGS